MSRQLLTRNDRVAQMTKQEELIAKKKREILEKQKNAEIAKTIAANMSSSNNCATTTNNLCSGNNCSTIQDINTSNDDTFDNTTNELVTGTDTAPTLASTTISSEAAVTTSTATNTVVPVSVATPNTSTISSTCSPAIRNTFSNDGSFMEKFKKFAEAALLVNHLAEGSSEMNESGSNADENNIVEAKPFIQPADMSNQNFINCPTAAFTTSSVSFAQMPVLISAELPAYTTTNLLNNSKCTSSNIPSLINSNEINLNTIPQPKPLSLNEIPPPKELDLNAIPKPELNLDAIKIPIQHNQQEPPGGLLLSQIKEEVGSSSNAIPPTLDQLIDTVAECGDEFEQKIIALKNDIPPSLWFLFSKESETYKVYRENVQMKRQQLMVVDKKYDPSEIYHDKDDDGCNDSDSDYEYMKEAKERNLRNIKRKITNPRNDDEYYTSDSDDDNDRFSRYNKNRDDFLDKCTGIADGGEGGGVGGGRNGSESSDSKSSNRSKIKKSRWGDKVIDLGINEQNSSLIGITQQQHKTHTQNIVLGEPIKPLLSHVTRSDPALLQYARQNFGSIDLSEEDWKKAEEHYKIYLLYQDMLKKRDEIDRLAKSGKFKYEYDSDEDTTGGTWEHKLRSAEMKATEIWAEALNKQSEGKHHIGDFLPPEELKKFMEKYNAKKNNREPDLSDYKEYKLTEENIGFQMLQKLGWKEGQGLGAGGSGIVDPINKASRGESNQGLGASALINPNEEDNEYDAYRKRMMLAYRFRPNPLNNPRRAYY